MVLLIILYLNHFSQKCQFFFYQCDLSIPLSSFFFIIIVYVLRCEIIRISFFRKFAQLARFFMFFLLTIFFPLCINNDVRSDQSFRLYSIDVKCLIGRLLSRESHIKILTHGAARTNYVTAQCALQRELIIDYCNGTARTRLHARVRARSDGSTVGAVVN